MSTHNIPINILACMQSSSIHCPQLLSQIETWEKYSIGDKLSNSNSNSLLHLGLQYVNDKRSSI